MLKILLSCLVVFGVQISIVSASSSDPDAGTCFGTTSGMSVGEDRVDHYSKMWSRYQNCTIVKGNLEITGLESPALDISFLKNIEMVTGYVIIALNYVPYLPLEKLKIIRGRELYRGQYSLYITVNYNSEDPKQAMKELRLKSLTEIVRGSVYIRSNKLCYVDTIHWNDIMNPVSKMSGQWFAEVDDKVPKSCGNCDPLCNGKCWGSGPKMCQNLTLEICASDCGNARCRGPSRDDCCDSECAAGCTGPTDRDCMICLHVNDSGLCKNSCPPARIYDPQTQRNIPNPHFKYHYSDKCVDECPSNLLVEDNGCVKSCRVGYHNDGFGKCVQCKQGSCDRECYGVGHQDGPLKKFKTVDSSNIHFFEGCSIIKGNLIFQSFAFVGDNHTGLASMNTSQLRAFRNVKVITGFLHIVSWPKQLTNFSVFQNLQRIDGVDLYKDLVGLVIQDSTHNGPFYLNQITSLGFRSLKQISHGNVYIGYLKSLCYHRMVDWTKILSHPVLHKGFRNGSLFRNNKPEDECNGTVCDVECTSGGCWGPGPDQCLECIHVSYNGVCLRDCTEELGIYAVPGETECRRCHPECTFSCVGEGPGNCTTCRHLRDGEVCVEQCPVDKYPDKILKECLPCNATCLVHEDEPMCTGPNDTLGEGGCNYCDYIVTTRELEVIRCLPLGEQCPFAHFTHEGKTLNSAQHNCMPCFEGCNNCTGLAREHCAHPISSADDTLAIVAVVPVICGVLFVVFGFIFGYRHRKKQILKKRQHSMRALGIDPHSPEEQNIDPRARLMEPMTPSGVAPNQAQLRIVKDAELHIGKILGSGAFGTVHKGYWIPDLAPREKVKVPVAIKVLRDESSQVASNEILDEAFVMASCEHPNLVRLLGISLSQRIMLISQLMPLGNLLEYVRDNKENIGSQHLLNWCLQITKGMRYLSEEKHLVHRDLAARNVLVKSPNHVRITDFGLAKLLDVNEDVYRAEGGKMPIKWLALESIQHRIFTQKSDVWSFGVTMWELMTFGKKPYENVPAREVHTLLERGERLPQPYICTIDIYMLLIKCWTVDAEARPTFRELSEDLSKMARDPQRYIVIDNEGLLDELPNPTTSEFLRSLMNEDGDDFPITDAEEYLHPQTIDSANESLSDAHFSLQPAPDTVPWKRQHNQPLSSTSSQQGLLDARASGKFQDRMERLRGLPHNDNRLDSAMTTLTNLSSVSGSIPNGSSTPFASVTMPMSADLCEEEFMLGADGIPSDQRFIPHHLRAGVANNCRTLSESSDVFGPTLSKRGADTPGQGCDILDHPQARLVRAREDSTTMRYSAEPVARNRQQTKPNEYLDPSEFPPSPFALKPPVDILELPTSSMTNPEYEPTFVPTENGGKKDPEGYEIPFSPTEYENILPEDDSKTGPGYDLRHQSQSGESTVSEKRDSGMQSDDDSEKKQTAVNNPNYEYLGDANSDAVILGEHGKVEYVNTPSDSTKLNFAEDDIFSLVNNKNHKQLQNKDTIGRTYSEPDSGVGIEVAVDNLLYHKLANAWGSNE